MEQKDKDRKLSPIKAKIRLAQLVRLAQSAQNYINTL